MAIEFGNKAAGGPPEGNRNARESGESLEDMAARRLNEALARVEGDKQKMLATQGDAEGAYRELMAKVDAKAKKDITTAEEAAKRLRGL